MCDKPKAPSDWHAIKPGNPVAGVLFAWFVQGIIVALVIAWWLS